MRTNPLKQEYIRSQIQNLDRVFCLHQYQEKEVQLVFGIPTEKTVVSGNGYNPIIFHRLEGIQPHTGYHLSFAGKISEKKGVFSLIRSLHFLPYPQNTLRVSLAGGYRNSDYQVVTELIRRCPYPGTLCGNLAQDQLARLFNESDLFVLPSFYDGLPFGFDRSFSMWSKSHLYRSTRHPSLARPAHSGSWDILLTAAHHDGHRYARTIRFARL